LQTRYDRKADITARDVVAGMDASQMDESLYEAQWQAAGEEDYHPFTKSAISLE